MSENKKTFFDRKELPTKEVVSGITLSSIFLNDVMITMVDLAPGALLPEHSHPHEQITYIVSGSLEFTVAGEQMNLGAGQGAAVGSGVAHSGVAGPKGAYAIDAWSPPRDDYKID